MINPLKSTVDSRKLRKELKGKLFTIRRNVQGEDVKLDVELIKLKELFESKPNFTKWEDFPEKWDIGDPTKTKKGMHFDEIEMRRFDLLSGKPLHEIIEF